MIEVSDLRKNYGDKTAVKNVSFAIHPGEVVGLLGPNGAGKTTTLNMITGVIFPDNGSVRINDQSLAQNELSIKKMIGYLSEDNPLYTTLTVAESIRLAADLKGVDRSKYVNRLHELLPLVGLQNVMNKTIDTLSKGYRQRVGLAQALIGDPDILILDEPTEGLDPNQRREIRDLIKSIGENHTVLLSTHVMQEVEAICQRVIILNEGSLVASGTVDEVTRGQDEMVEIELKLGGLSKNGIVSILQNEFEDVRSDEDDEIVVVKMNKAREENFYQIVSDQVSQHTYITHLKKKHIGLEEAFRKLTKADYEN